MNKNLLTNLFATFTKAIFFISAILMLLAYSACSSSVSPGTTIEEPQPIDDENTDDENTDDENTDDENTDDENTDDENTDDENTDDENTDDENTDDENTDAGQQTYTVSFNTDEGSPVPSQGVNSGNVVARPDNPTKEAYIFGNWFTDEALTRIYIFSNPVKSNLTLYASWIPEGTNTYTVTFNIGGGNAPETQTIAEGQRAIRPDNLTRAGHRLVNWYENSSFSGEPYNFENAVTNDIALYANWIRVFIVTFSTNAGGLARTSVSEANEVPVDSNALVPRPDNNPTRVGHRFLNWCIDPSPASRNNDYDFINTLITENTTIYANWIRQFTVSFETDGGLPEVGQQTVDSGTAVPIPTPAPTRAGQNLLNWYTNPSFPNTAYDFANTKVTHNITLHANWGTEDPNEDEEDLNEEEDPNTYDVVFDTRGGGNILAQHIEEGNMASRPDNPTRTDGYRFLNWYENSSFSGQPYNFENTEVTTNITLYANWLRQFTVSFETANGGTDVATQTVDSGTAVTIPTPAPTRSGYRFDNWYIDLGDLNTAYNFANTKVTHNITLHANWVIKQFTVSFETANGGTDVATQTVDSGTAVPIPIPDPTRSGYRFLNWYIDGGNSTDVYHLATTPVTTNITLRANWLRQFTVSFETANGGTDVATQTVDSGTAVTIPTPDPTRSGYRFDNWYANSSFSGQPYNFATKVTHDMPLHANWIRQFTVTFDTDGGTDVATQTVDFNAMVTGIATTKTGYSFLNWYIDGGDPSTDYGLATPVTANITLRANWEELEGHKITFNSRGGRFESNGRSVLTEFVDDGATISKPTDPTNTEHGGISVEWYIDKSLENKYNFNNPVTDSLTLYAKWEYMVTYTSSAITGLNTDALPTTPRDVRLVVPSKVNGQEIRTIGERAFSTSIGSNASTNTRIVSLRIAEGIENIGERAFQASFNSTTRVPNGIIAGELHLPNSLLTIGQYAFQNCSGFTGRLTIPNTVTSIGRNAFQNCSGFTGLTIGSVVERIQLYAFSGCTGFTGNLTIPNSVTHIENNAFNNCSGFDSVTIGNSVEYIGDGAFRSMTSVRSFVFTSSTPPGIGTDIFSKITTNFRIIVPRGTVDDYVRRLGSGLRDRISEATE